MKDFTEEAKKIIDDVKRFGILGDEKIIDLIKKDLLIAYLKGFKDSLDEQYSRPSKVMED